MPNCYCCGLVHDNNDVIRSLSYIDVVFPFPFWNPNDYTSDDSVNLWYTKFKAKSLPRSQQKSQYFIETAHILWGTNCNRTMLLEQYKEVFMFVAK